MAAEKQIVKYWLNKKGFYTIEDIKAGNRDIDFIAIKFKEGSISRIKHIEVSCSISSTTVNLSKLKDNINRHIKTKFANPAITDKIIKIIKEFKGAEKDYEKVFVLSMLPASNKKEIIENFRKKGIIIYEFENILSDVIQEVDTHYYRDDTMRTLQIFKYLLLAKPIKLAKLIGSKEENVLKKSSKERIFSSLMKEGKMKTAISKVDEKEIAYLIKYSSLKKPAALAKIIAEDVLGKRSRGRFIRALMEQENMKRFFNLKEEAKKEIAKKEKPLGFFFK